MANGIVCDSNILLGVIVALGGALVSCVIYIWRGGNTTAQKIASTQATCLAALPERFVSMATYREDIKDIYNRQAELRERLPRDFLMRSEADTFLGAVKELKGEISGLRKGFEERFDRFLMANGANNHG